MRVVTVAFLSPEVVCAHNGRGRDHLTACSHTQVSHMIGHRTPQTSHHLSFGGLAGGASTVVAAEAGVQRAAEASVFKHGQSTQPHTGLMIETATVERTAAPHLSFRLLAGETHMHTCTAGSAQDLFC